MRRPIPGGAFDLGSFQMSKDKEKIAADTQRDFWLTTEEAVAYGLLDKVIAKADQLV